VRLLRKLLGWTSLAVVIGVGGAIVGAALLGYERYVITGDSMSGTYDRGSLLFSEHVSPSELEVGDVITYDPPAAAGQDGLVTHRIVAVQPGPEGPVYRTKGDANASADPWRFQLDGDVQARGVVNVPYVGYGIAALSYRGLRLLLIGLPAIVIALVLLAGLWRQAGEEAAAAAAVQAEAPQGA
jgi:signal peptidase